MVNETPAHLLPRVPQPFAVIHEDRCDGIRCDLFRMAMLVTAHTRDHRDLFAEFPRAPGPLLRLGPRAARETRQDRRVERRQRVPEIPAVGHPGKKLIEAIRSREPWPHRARFQFLRSFPGQAQDALIEVGEHPIEVNKQLVHRSKVLICMTLWYAPAMRAVDLITKKRDGGEHSAEEIEFLIRGYVDGSIPEYQVSAWLMAVFFNGMTGAEAGVLTRMMIESGDTIDLSTLSGPLVDKHSTGGVGDKVSLILAPVAAACGIEVPMMSGRALGHTGGTLDKLESIPGFSTALTPSRFAEIIGEAGFAMTGQSKAIVPADRLLYALRDVTGTVESVPLITASIMSKKFAEGAESLIFDVKTGSGAFMKDIEASRTLAQSLLSTGKSLGRGVVAVITRMSEPLGYMVGNFLEVEESIHCLMGSSAPESFRYPQDLMDVTLRLTAWMLVAGGKASSVDEAEDKCRAVIENGAALERFWKNVELQGGDREATEKALGTIRAPAKVPVKADADGVVADIDAFTVGMAGVGLGVGRSKTDDDVLPDVGFEFVMKVGDSVRRGDDIAYVYGQDSAAASVAASAVSGAITVSDSAPDPGSIIVEEHESL